MTRLIVLLALTCVTCLAGCFPIYTTESTGRGGYYYSGGCRYGRVWIPGYCRYGRCAPGYWRCR